MNSQFASYGFADAHTLAQQRKLVETQKLFIEALEGVTDAVLLLNGHRQTVYANSSLCEYVASYSYEDIFGLRPGNLFGCVHACTQENGCGISAFCKYCGAAQVILESLDENADENAPSIKECRIRRTNGESLDLLVKGKKIIIEGQQFSLFSIRDISDRKRRRILERVFFHDILNTVGGIRSLAELLQFDEDSSNHMHKLLYNLSNDLISEIQAQQDLTAAEAGELKTNFITYPAEGIVNKVVQRYREHHLSQDKHIKYKQYSESSMIVTDERILSTVLGNMIRNALEASRKGETVQVGCESTNGAVRIWVHNPGVIPEDAQMQLFQRSFSTKGSRRGLGTYSIKLLTERYLKGKVGFQSSEEEGTEFYVII